MVRETVDKKLAVLLSTLKIALWDRERFLAGNEPVAIKQKKKQKHTNGEAKSNLAKVRKPT